MRSLHVPVVLALATVSVATRSSQALQPIPGPGIDAAGVGFADPSIVPAVGSRVTDGGLAVGEARPVDASGSINGSTSIFWTRTSAGALPRVGPASGPGSAQATFPQAANNGGTVIGYAQIRSSAFGVTPMAVRWDNVHATPVVLEAIGVGAFGERQSDARALNDSGVIAGSAHVYDDAGKDLGTRAVYWPAGSTTPVALSPLGFRPNGTTNSTANALNASGTVVGQADDHLSGTDAGPRAVRWNAGSSVATRLDNLGANFRGVGYAVAVAVNDAGTAVGSSDRYDTGTRLGTRPVRWDADQTAATELAIPSTQLNGYGNGGAIALNGAGTTIGYAERYDSKGAPSGYDAIRWDAGQTTATVLGNLGLGSDGYTVSFTADINAKGAIVGSSDRYDAEGGTLGTRAVLWRADSTVAIDLNTRLSANGGWTLVSADGLSDTGFVSGIGLFDPDGATGAREPYRRPYTLLTPEAGTYGDGDANFDALVNFDDLLILAKHYGKPSGGAFDVADFDLDGVTNFDDLLALARNFNANVPMIAGATSDAFAARYALARSLVPEPTSFAALAMFGGVARRRR